jgi:hypothetical protein
MSEMSTKRKTKIGKKLETMEGFYSVTSTVSLSRTNAGKYEYNNFMKITHA